MWFDDFTGICLICATFKENSRLLCVDSACTVSLQFHLSTYTVALFTGDRLYFAWLALLFMFVLQCLTTAFKSLLDSLVWKKHLAMSGSHQPGGYY